MYAFEVRVMTDHPLGEPECATEIIQRFRFGLPERLRVTHFGMSERGATLLTDRTEADALAAWTKLGIGLVLSRKSTPRYKAFFNWRKEKGLDPRPFPWGCAAYVDKSARPDEVVTLLKELVAGTRAVFGFAHPSDAVREKHLVTYSQPALGISSTKFVGADIGETLPGIYWITYFGPAALARVPLERLRQVPARSLEKFGEGYLLTLSEPFAAEREELERRAVSVLGLKLFFDKSAFDASSLGLTSSGTHQARHAIEKKKMGKKDST